MKNPLVKPIAIAVALLPLSGVARADVLLDNTHLIALPAVAAPAEFPFTTTTAEALTVTLTDIQQPAPFVTLQIAVTLGDTLVGSAPVDPATHVATVAIPAGVGNYVLHVVGLPDPTQTVGGFGACVTRNSDPAPRACIAADSFSGNIQIPSTPSAASSALQANFTSSATAGVYTVTITDDVFPVALQSVAGGITQGSAPVNTTSFALGTNQVNLAAGTTYTLVLGAAADANTQAGLYGVHITDPAGTAVFDRTVPVGTLPPATVVNNPTAQILNLTLNDLAYPAPLASVGVAVTSGSASLATLTASGSNPNVTVPAGSLQIWQYSVPGVQPGVYTLNLSNSDGAPSVFSTTQVIDPPASASPQSYAFVENLTAAGSYQVLVTDFNFPSSLSTVPVATVAQNGILLPQSSTGVFSAAAGNVVVLVTAAAPTSGSGIFGVTLQTSAATPQILLDETQTVGATFSTQSVVVKTAGSYDVTLADLGFPANFQSLAVVLSQGSQVLGKIFGGGTFSFSGTPGTYVLTFVDTPISTAPAAASTATVGYGLYSARVQSSAPTLTFTSSAATVAAGGSVSLTWGAPNATACTASGSSAWTGSEPVSGTASVVISATAALTLTCTGAGGSTAQTVNIAVTAAPAKVSTGGGGDLDWMLLAALAAMLGTGLWRQLRAYDVAHVAEL
jgi:hypothetical protein